MVVNKNDHIEIIDTKKTRSIKDRVINRRLMSLSVSFVLAVFANRG